MSKKANNEAKEYQLWVWYENQDTVNTQNGWELLCESESTEDIFMSVASLGKGDRYFTTRTVDLRVQAL